MSTAWRWCSRDEDISGTETLSSKSFSYICATCGQRHEGTPGLSFDAPLHYHQMPAAEREKAAILTADTCEIAGEDFFIRVCLEVPVHGHDESFVWGVWVSLSRPNFDRYVSTLGKDLFPEGGPYLGWFCNRLPGYPDTLNLKARVHFRLDNLRPWIELEPTEHPLAIAQREGMSIEEVQRILEANHHDPPVA